MSRVEYEYTGLIFCKGEFSMKNSKPRTVLKPIRIPEKVVKEIEQEASSRNTTFSDIANYRLQHHQNPLTPELLAKIQDICNHAIEAVKNNSLTMAKTTELEVSLLWKYLK